MFRRRTGSRERSRLLALGLMTGLVLAAAARADVTVSPRLDPPRVAVGEAARLDVEVAGTQHAAVPAIDVPDGLRLDYRGQSSQVSIVNGSVSATVTYTFVLTPGRAGTFVVGPIKVQAGGRDVDGGTVRLQVAAGAAPGGSGAAPAGAGARQGTARGDEPLALVVEPAASRVYLHERLPVHVRLEVGNVQVTDVRYPTLGADGFTTGELGEPTQRQDVRGGRRVQVVDFPTEVVPVRAGDLSLAASMQLSVVTHASRPLFDRFFGMDLDAGRRPMVLQADAVPITVLPLPATGRPASFGGAVGRFDLQAAVHPAEVRAGDPVTITFTLRGEGNLAHAKPPSLEGGRDLRSYPPTTVSEDAQGARVEKRFEQVVIPQSPGEVTLPPLEFAYFDPKTESYRTTAAEPLEVRVLPGAAPAAAVPPPAPAAASEQALGHDLVFIKDDPGALARRGARRWRQPGFWALQAVPPLGWLLLGVWDRRRRRLAGDERFARFTRAGERARRGLRDAERAAAAGDRARAWDGVARVVHEYLAAKLDLPPGGVSPEAVAGRLAAVGVRPALVEEARALLVLCGQVRFAPSAAGDPADALARVGALVRGLERARGVSRAAAAAVLLLALGASLAAAATESPKTLFFRGNALYADEQYAAAAAAYEAVLTAGVESPHLYFNLGTAYAKAGDRGRAVLNYERARRLAPSDADVAANLRFVTGGADAEAAPLAVRLALPLALRASSDALLAAAAVAWWVLVGALALRGLVPRARRGGAALALGAALVLAATAPAAAYRVLRVDRPDWAVVLEDAAVRFEPSDDATAHYDAAAGTMVEILGERADWVRVARRQDGRRGWIPRAALAPL